ncbi:MAG: hypothetical protein NXI32_19460 [bacterium]|nr:hypothetical protein [bacterium]
MRIQTPRTSRRQFTFALGLGLVSAKLAWGENGTISELPPDYLDWQQLAERGHVFEHWTPEEDGPWQWYRLERYIEATWKSVGISLPVNRDTGEEFEPSDGYIHRDEIPSYVLAEELPLLPEEVRRHLSPSQFDPEEALRRKPDPEIQLRDGRPPSDWLTSLNAEELRKWLVTIDAPPATVNGMTFWVHLIRDHSFDPRRIEGLSEHEFFLLHSAAHHGY